jgi:transposase-like protein
MRMPSEHVATAVGAYYEGRSISSIPEVMYQLCGSFVTKSSTDKWITRFTKLAIYEANKTKVNVGDIWITDENAVKVCGKSYWVMDIIDLDTRFLLATKLSYGRAVNDIKYVMETARDKAGKIPAQVITNGWKGYLDGIELAYGADVKRIQDMPLDSKVDSTRLAEYWHNTLKVRNVILSRLKLSDRAQLILDGWLVNYNYFRIQEALNGRTPSEIAKANFNFHNWLDLIYQSKTGTDVIKIQEPQVSVNVPVIRIPKSSRLIKELIVTNAPLLVSRKLDRRRHNK